MILSTPRQIIQNEIHSCAMDHNSGARQILVGWQKLQNFQTMGAKRYTKTFLLNFSITIFANYYKWGGGNCPLIPSPGHATDGPWEQLSDTIFSSCSMLLCLYSITSRLLSAAKYGQSKIVLEGFSMLLTK